MHKSYLFLIFFPVLILGSIACSEKRIRLDEKEFKQKYGESLVKTNKHLVKKDEEIIRNFINRKNWEMEMSGTGLFYEVYKKSSGEIAKPGKQATINYKIFLLDGTLCYSSDSLGPKTFKITHGGVEAGLEEGILLLHEGEKARFIMAPHLAYGLIGDNNKIPKRSTIIYDVELIKIAE